MKSYKVLLVILNSLVLLVSTSMAQEDTIKIDTSLVNVGVVVKNKAGNFVNNLNKDDFQVYDNNQKQEISLFSKEDEPISIGIVYDLHPTTNERNKVILNSLRKFSKELPVKYDIFSIVFNQNGSLSTDFVPTTEQVATFLTGEKQPQVNSLYDAVFAASNKIQEKKNLKKMLLIISDGNDNSSHHSFSELSKHLKSFNIQIYSIILGNNDRWEYSDITLNRRGIRSNTSFLSQANLKELSEKSGGNAENQFVDSENVLTNLFGQMIEEMKQQYIVSFYPKALDGKRHKIKVAVNSSPKQKMTIIHRKDYQSSSK